MNSLPASLHQRFRFRVFAALLLLCLSAMPAAAQESRTWTSKNGAFQKQAILKEANKDQVVLKLETGRIVEVPIAKLSTEDQKYLATLGTLSKANKEKKKEVIKKEKADRIVKLRGAKLGAEIQKRIAEFHQGAEQSNEVFRVVYFHGSDSGPQDNFRERLNDVFVDIQEFYFDEMEKNGFKATQKMPLELENGQLVVHVVAGKDPTNSYSSRSDSAREIRDQCELALRGKLDFDADYVIILCGLVKKDGERYIFNSPNYALPCDHTYGCSFVPDCEKFNIDLISDTQSKISYAKEDKRFVETLAKYNTRRTGATAHELAHALNLPHNGQTRSARKRKGLALMGSGSHSYRKQLWDRNSKGAFMTLSMSASLAAHPLFTGSDRGRWKVAKCRFESVNYSVKGRRFEIKGVVKSDPPPLAVTAFVDPADGGSIRDYDATTWVGGVGHDGAFHVTVDEHLPGPHELRLAVLLANGATEIPTSSQYEANEKGIPDVARLNSLQLVGPIEELLVQGKDARAAAVATDLIKQIQADGSKHSEGLLSQLKHIASLADPLKVELLSDVDTKTVFLSDVQWESAEAGFGEPARNRVYANPKKAKRNKSGVLLQIGGIFYKKGLYGHANSRFVFDLDGKWSNFESVAGLQTGAIGRVKFSVKGDGRVLFTSDELAGSKVAMVNLDVQGVKKLELIAESATRAKGGSWTAWGAPMLKR